MPLSPLEIALARLFVEASTGPAGALRGRLEVARAAGADDTQIGEVILLAMPYSGVPRTILAFTAWREISPRSATPLAAPADREATGAAAFGFVYGGKTARIRAELAALHPALDAAIYEDHYGRVLARTQLPWRIKELVVLPMLTALGAPRQVAAHALSARRAGASADEIIEAIRLAADRTPPADVDAVAQRIREILD